MSAPPSSSDISRSKQPQSQVFIPVVDLFIPTPATLVFPWDAEPSGARLMVELSEDPERIPKDTLRQAETNVETMIATIDLLTKAQAAMGSETRDDTRESDIQGEAVEREEMGRWIEAGSVIMKTLQKARPKYADGPKGAPEGYFPVPVGGTVASRYFKMSRDASKFTVTAETIACATEGLRWAAEQDLSKSSKDARTSLSERPHFTAGQNSLIALSNLYQCTASAYRIKTQSPLYEGLPGAIEYGHALHQQIGQSLADSEDQMPPPKAAKRSITTSKSVRGGRPHATSLMPVTTDDAASVTTVKEQRSHKPSATDTSNDLQASRAASPAASTTTMIQDPPLSSVAKSESFTAESQVEAPSKTAASAATSTAPVRERLRKASRVFKPKKQGSQSKD